MVCDFASGEPGPELRAADRGRALGAPHARRELTRNLRNLVRRFMHAPIAFVDRVLREWFAILRPQVLVAHKVERDLWRWRQDERVEMDGLTVSLPLANDFDLLVDDVVRRQ